METAGTEREALGVRGRAAVGEMLRSLRHRNFRLFFVGQALSQTGMWMQTVATAVVVLDVTDSGLLLGLVVAAQWAPMLLVGPWAGALADRHDRRKIILATQVGALTAAAALAVGVIGGATSLWLIFPLTAAIGIVAAIETPARIALAADVVPAEDVPNAVGLNASMLTAARVFGPIVAGLIIAGPGPGWCYAVHAVSRYPQAGLLRRMDPDAIRRPIMASSGPGSGHVRDGLRHIWDNRELRLPLTLLGITAFFAFNHNTVLPLLAERGLGGGPTTYTALFAGMSVGSAIGGLAIARGKTVTLPRLARASCTMALAYVALAVAPSTATAVALALPVGFFYLQLGGGTNTILQLNAAPDMQGRVLAMLPILSSGLAPLGGPIVGLLADGVGVRLAIVLSVLPCIGAAVVVTAVARRQL